MNIFYDPTTKQVRAIYAGDTQSTVWSDLGYTKVEVPDDLIDQATMDKKVTIVNDEVTGFEDWPRPVVSSDKLEITADGVDSVTITATFNTNISEDVVFTCGSIGAEETVSVSGSNTAQITFESENEGIFNISVFSPTYGISFISIEAVDV